MTAPRLVALALVVGLVAGCALTEQVLPTPLPTTVENPEADWAWIVSPKDRRGADGQMFEYVCPPGGHAHDIWGTDIYTDDSSVCNAAVHAGLITFRRGGRVRIMIRPGLDAYEGSERNGMISDDYGHWNGSFVFVGS